MHVKLPPVVAPIEPQRLSLRCPGCSQVGVFDWIPSVADAYVQAKPSASSPEDMQLGQRICPNQHCRTHVFVIQKRGGNLLACYPRVLEDFNADRVPALIAKSFREALVCQGEQLWVPAAIMIRRTLEELCADKGATGKDLKARIGALRSTVVLPSELFDAIDDL